MPGKRAEKDKVYTIGDVCFNEAPAKCRGKHRFPFLLYQKIRELQ